MSETTHEQCGMKIKDSGTRRDFGTGSVRDAATGKGRMDLMPMNFLVSFTHGNAAQRVSDHLATYYPTGVVFPRRSALRHMACFMRGEGQMHLFYAAVLLLEALGRDDEEERTYGEQVPGVTVPNWEGLLKVSKLYEAGCLKYGDRNWEKGQPIHVYIDSAMRHLVKDIARHVDEDHRVAACWNVLCALETLEWVAHGELPVALLDGLPARVKTPLLESFAEFRRESPVAPDGKFEYAP
jgi:hypothetical protein